MNKLNSLTKLSVLLMLFLGIKMGFPALPGTIQTVSSSSLPISLADGEMGPNIQNVFINPENITMDTQIIDIRASVTDGDGISWVRVFACLTDDSGFQVLCLPPQEMTTRQGDIWEAEVQLLFAKAVGDNIGFNITAQDHLGGTSIYYTIRTVTDANTSTKEAGFGIWGSFLRLALVSIVAVGIRHRKKKKESFKTKSV
ncbi:MAG: hypothetical protein ACFFB3_05075 [Candidatus Hodarchaeota archaeon]